MKKLSKDSSWMTRAACKGMDANLFFENDEGEFPYIDEAENVCLTCPVRTECCDYAVSNSIETEGLWGLTDYSGRLKIKRATRNPYERYKGPIDSLARDFSYLCL